MKQLEETGLAYDPGFVKLMINAGEALGESKAVIGNGTTPNGIKSARNSLDVLKAKTTGAGCAG